MPPMVFAAWRWEAVVTWAYLLPSSFATIAMLHGHEYSSRNQIYLFGIIMIVITSLIIGFVGYPIGCALTGS